MLRSQRRSSIVVFVYFGHRLVDVVLEGILITALHTRVLHSVVGRIFWRMSRCVDLPLLLARIRNPLALDPTGTFHNVSDEHLGDAADAYDDRICYRLRDGGIHELLAEEED